MGRGYGLYGGPQYESYKNTYDALIAITATIADNKRLLANKIAPTCFEYSTQQAQEDGILNKTKFYLVNYDIGQKRDIEIKWKQNGSQRSFFQSENGLYLYNQEKFDKALWALQSTDRKLNTASIMGEDTDELEKSKAKYIYQMKMFSRKRKEFLHSLVSSQKVTKLLINKIHETPGNKILVFSKLTKQADAICEHTFHSKNNSTDVEGRTLLDRLSQGFITTLAVCDAVDRGINLDQVNHIIHESYVGSETEFQQKHGRGMRLEAEDTLHYFILFPHYWERKKVEEGGLTTWQWARQPTQAKAWLENMTEGFDLSNMQVIDIQYDERTDTYRLPDRLL
jgi:superfamily II DNA or RNA helicase